MRLLSAAGVGELFKVAHPDQWSLNKIKMDRHELYRVDRIFGSSPYIRICLLAESPLDARIRTLMPTVPILGVKELAPSTSDIEKFLLGPSTPKTKVVAYELTWDGETQIYHRLQPQERTVFVRLWLSGRTMFTVEEMRESLSKIKLTGKISATRAFAFYAPHLSELGLLKETREQRNSASRKLHEIVGA